MSKLQFVSLLGPAVGSFVLVILAWMQSNYRLSDLKDNINQRFSNVDRQFEHVDRQFERMDARLLRIENDQREFYGITQKLEGRIDEISRQ